MKHIIFFLLFALGTFAATGQTKYTIDATGNYHAEKKVTGPVTFESLTKNAINTGKTAEDSKGVFYKVYESKKGKRFYVKQSAKGNFYSVYL